MRFNGYALARALEERRCACDRAESVEQGSIGRNLKVEINETVNQNSQNSQGARE